MKIDLMGVEGSILGEELPEVRPGGGVDVEPGKATIDYPGMPPWLMTAVAYLLCAACFGGLLDLKYGFGFFASASVFGLLFLAFLAAVILVVVVGLIFDRFIPPVRWRVDLDSGSFRVLTQEEVFLADYFDIMASVLPPSEVPPPEPKEKLSFWPSKNPSDGERARNLMAKRLARLDALSAEERAVRLRRLEQIAGHELDRLLTEAVQKGLSERRKQKALRRGPMGKALLALNAMRSPKPLLEFVTLRVPQKGELIKLSVSFSSQNDADSCRVAFPAGKHP